MPSVSNALIVTEVRVAAGKVEMPSPESVVIVEDVSSYTVELTTVEKSLSPTQFLVSILKSYVVVSRARLL